MENKKRTMLSEQDLDFITHAVFADSTNKIMRSAIQNDPAFRQAILSDDNLFAAAIQNHSLYPGVSLNLFFEILLRHSVKEMKKETHTLERTAFNRRIPVFDLEQTLEFLDNDGILDYLTWLLSSFTTAAERLDLNKLMNYGSKVTGEELFEINRKIGDACLFILGIFPEHVTPNYYSLFNRYALFGQHGMNSADDYEWLGRQSYLLAAKEKIARTQQLDKTLHLLSENLTLAKNPLNYLSQHYLPLAK
jgi:hypothetical protein